MASSSSATAVAASGEAGEAGGAVRPGDVVVFSRPACGYCVRAKALLKSRGVPFGVVDVVAEPSRRAQAVELSGGRTTVPQVFVGQKPLGGYDDLLRLDEEGTLLPALAEVEGQPIPPTPAELLKSSERLPEDVVSALKQRGEELRELQRTGALKAGSQPTIRAFLKYAVTSRPAQDQSDNVPLNAAAPRTQSGPGLPDASAAQLGDLLRRAMLQLLEAFGDATTAQVDYPRMRDSEDWGLFLALTEELADPRLEEGLLAMSVQERKAFLLNLYNVMTFHGVVAFGRRGGLWNLYCFYIAPAVTYRVAGVPMSLDDVENGMLRAQPGYFRDTQDPGDKLKRNMRMPDLDPRIHMALNCGATSCPAVAVYSPDVLDAELDEATVGFLASDANLLVEPEQDGGVKITCSELFKMYTKDWAGGAKAGQETNAAIARWAAQYTSGEKRKQLEAALESGSKLRVEHFPYDWSSNGPDIELDKRVYTPRF